MGRAVTPPFPAIRPAIRRTDARDMGGLARLHAGSFEERWSRDAFARVLALPSGFAFVARLEAETVGFVLGRIAADECEVLTLVVAPTQRRRGIGRALLAATLGHAQGQGVRHAFLEVAADNQPARALYAAAGFRRVGVREGYYRRGASRIDAWTLKRALEG
ncbi:MAG: ribosomal protein S18-alanine N-acetyltransferase [Alphaproteobacteria bacterium]